MYTTTIIINLFTISLAGLAAAAPAPVSVNLETRMDYRAVCSWHNQGLFHSYGVQGGGFSVGDWGEHLRNNLKGCGGTMSGWKFNYNKQINQKGADWWEWSAEFILPIGQSRCAGHAVDAVGGKSVTCNQQH